MGRTTKMADANAYAAKLKISPTATVCEACRVVSALLSAEKIPEAPSCCRMTKAARRLGRECATAGGGEQEGPAALTHDHARPPHGRLEVRMACADPDQARLSACPWAETLRPRLATPHAPSPSSRSPFWCTLMSPFFLMVNERPMVLDDDCQSKACQATRWVDIHPGQDWGGER